MKSDVKVEMILRGSWKRVRKAPDRFEITEDSVDAIVSRGEEMTYYDHYLRRYYTKYVERTYMLRLDSARTKLLYESARAHLRAGASEDSIRDMMKDMAIRALDGKPLMPRQSDTFYYVFLASVAALVLGLLWIAWDADAAWVKPVKRTLLMTFGSTDTRVETLEKDWNLEDAVSVYGGMAQEEALQRMQSTLESFSGAPSIVYEEYGTLGTEWVYEVPGHSMRRTMQVAMALKEKGFFTQEQYEQLAEVFFRRYPDAEYAFRDDGVQVFLAALDACSDGFLSDFYATATERARLPLEVQEYIGQRLAEEQPGS